MLGTAVMARSAMWVVIIYGTFDVRVIVFEPTINCPAVPRDCTVPSTVAPGAPGLGVLPAIAITFDAAAIAWPPIIVVIWAGTLGARGIVDVSIARVDEPKCIGIPDAIIGGAPLVKVVPAVEIP